MRKPFGSSPGIKYILFLDSPLHTMHRLIFQVVLVFVSILYMKCLAYQQHCTSPEAGLTVVPLTSLSCHHGFYTEEELKPHLRRPPQDPRAQGAHGQPFTTSQQLNFEQQREQLQGYTKHQFNQFASDRISLHRDLGEDTRHPDCLEQKFLRCPGLPTTSVIIVFHNEAWSTLLRTVYSVLHTAPAALLEEIILVDDGSTDVHLKSRLDVYVQQLKIVRVLRQKEWKGLTPARLLGAKFAQGEVLTFLDSHCECFPGWLEPLLARIAQQPTAVVSPQITTIDFNDFEFEKPVPRAYEYRAKFNWELRFEWEHIPEEEKKQRKNETYPVRTPAFTGGLFSISKSYFEHIGTYDDQMEFWGGENLEMSFKVWQCGGQLEIIPCSVVGHVHRKYSPHTYPNKRTVITHNLVRAAEVWMDDYKWIFYRLNRMAAYIHEENFFGNVTERHELRRTLKCRSFAWYLENLSPGVYVPDIIPIMHGQLENIDWGCSLDAEITNDIQRPVQHFQCSSEDEAKYFEYTSQKEVRLSSALGLCLHVTSEKDVSLERCQLTKKGTAVAPEQEWLYTKKKQLMNPSSGKCLTVLFEYVFVITCESAALNQKWAFTRS